MELNAKFLPVTPEEARSLSTGERKMLHNAKQILISEIVLAKSCAYEEVEQQINRAMA